MIEYYGPDPGSQSPSLFFSRTGRTYSSLLFFLHRVQSGRRVPPPRGAVFFVGL